MTPAPVAAATPPPFGQSPEVHLATAHVTFLHPGIPLTKSDLETLKANLTKEPWSTGYQKLVNDSHSRLDYKMRGPFEHVSRNPHVKRNQWMSDMQAVYNLSRMWYFTGDQAYAQKAHDILLAWATTQKDFTGMESNLDLGDYAYRYGGGADILRGTWPGWTQADTDAVKNLFENVYWPACGGNVEALGPANKGMLSLCACAALATFCDDQEKFNFTLNRFRTTAACALPNTLSNGEIGETARDNGHAYGQWLSMAFLAEVFWKQGVDVYSEQDNRLLAVGEYYARCNHGVSTPYIPMGTTDALYLNRATVPWPHGLQGFNILHAAYVMRKGIAAPYVDIRRNELTEDGDSFMFNKSADTSTATALPPFAFPLTASVTTGLRDRDMGNATGGSSAYDKGTWTVKGSGNTIWTHDQDNFHYTYKTLTGDGAIIAKVNSLETTGKVARAGVMIRETLEPNTSAKAWVAITPNRTADFFMHGWTEVRGGGNWEKKSRPIPGIPYWVKLERIGPMISLYTSQDGMSWGCIGAGKFAHMGSSVYLGLAVCSSDADQANTATFSDVQITGGDGKETPHLPAAPFAIYASPGDKQVPLRWLGSSGANNYNVKRATNAQGPYDKIACVKGTSYVDSTTTPGHSYFYVVSAVDAAGESANSVSDTVTLPGN